MRRYEPSGRPAFWEARLPPGCTHGGVASCSRNWREGFRTEAAAKAEALAFLLEWAASR